MSNDASKGDESKYTACSFIFNKILESSLSLNKYDLPVSRNLDELWFPYNRCT